jgi:hypothetical protein
LLASSLRDAASRLTLSTTSPRSVSGCPLNYTLKTFLYNSEIFTEIHTDFYEDFDSDFNFDSDLDKDFI